MILHWEWIIVAAALVCDANSWGHKFVIDDAYFIARIPPILKASHFVHIFSPPLFRPLTALVLSITYWIGGAHPDGFHLINRLLHVLACLGIFWVVRRLIPEPPTTALFTSLLFAVHPIQTEAITYIFGLADALAMVFFIFAWLYFVRMRQSTAPPITYYLLSLLFYFLALLSKENAIPWLGIAFLTELVYFSKFSIRSFLRQVHKGLWTVYAGYIVVTLAYLALRSASFRGVTIDPTSFVVNPLVTATFPARLLTPLKIWFQSMGQMILPIHFSPDYSYNAIPLIEQWTSPAALGVLSLTAMFLMLLVWTYKRFPHLFFGLGYFVITYFIVSNLVVLIGTIHADRLLYMPALGFCLMGGTALARLQEISGQTSWRNAFRVGVAGLLLLLAGRTIVRNGDWRDEFTLYLEAVRHFPNSVKLRGLLGRQYLAHNQPDQALEQFRIALSIHPDLPDLLFDVGTVLARKGNVDEAIVYFHRALALGASNPDRVRTSLALALQARGDLTGAIEQLDAIIQHSPASSSPHFYKANALYLMGRIPDAIDELHRVLELNPAHKEAKNNLNLLLQESKPKPITPAKTSR